MSIILSDIYVPKRKNFNMCHASNFIALDNDSFLITYFAGTYEGNDDCSIYLCKVIRDKDGQLREISNKKAFSSSKPHWNPILFRIDKNKIALFYKVGKEISLWETMISFSDDNGLTFGNSKKLIQNDKGGRGPVRCKALYMSNGKIAFGASTEKDKWQSFIDISDINLINFEKSNIISVDENILLKADTSTIPLSKQSFSGQGIIQPTLFEDEDGIHALFRSSYGYIYKADSKDFAHTWSKAYKINVVNNNSGIDVDKYKDDIYLVCNNSQGNFSKRSPLTLFKSKNGKYFTKIQDIEIGDGEFSYPCIRFVNNKLFISYTYNREAIKFIEVNLLNCL